MRKGTREYTGISSYTPSPKMKPRSSTGTRASSTGMNLPFRKTMLAPLLEPEAQCIPGPHQNACGGNLFERDHGVFAERLAVERHAQVADPGACRDRRDERRQSKQFRLQPVALT